MLTDRLGRLPDHLSLSQLLTGRGSERLLRLTSAVSLSVFSSACVSRPCQPFQRTTYALPEYTIEVPEAPQSRAAHFFLISLCQWCSSRMPSPTWQCRPLHSSHPPRRSESGVATCVFPNPQNASGRSPSGADFSSACQYYWWPTECCGWRCGATPQSLVPGVFVLLALPQVCHCPVFLKDV